MRYTALSILTFLIPLWVLAQTPPRAIATIPLVTPLDAMPLIHVNGGIGVLAVTFSDSLRINDVTLRSRGLRDVALACFNASGGVHWVNHIGGPADDSATAVQVGWRTIILAAAVGGRTGMPSTVRVNNITLATQGEYDAATVGFLHSGRLELFRVDGGPFADIPSGMTANNDGISLLVTFVRQTRFNTQIFADSIGESSCAIAQFSPSGSLVAASAATPQSFGSAAIGSASMWATPDRVTALVTTIGDVLWNGVAVDSERMFPSIVSNTWSSYVANVVAVPSDCRPETLVCAPLGDAIAVASFEPLPCEADVLPSLVLWRYDGVNARQVRAYHSSSGQATILSASSSPEDVAIAGSFRGRMQSPDGRLVDAGSDTATAGFIVTYSDFTSVIRAEGGAVVSGVAYDGQRLHACAVVNGQGTVDGVPIGRDGQSSIVLLRYDRPSSVAIDRPLEFPEVLTHGESWTLWNLRGQIVAHGSESRLPSDLPSGVYVVGAPFQQPMLVFVP
jgi:hypothetical protein